MIKRTPVIVGKKKKKTKRTPVRTPLVISYTDPSEDPEGFFEAISTEAGWVENLTQSPTPTGFSSTKLYPYQADHMSNYSKYRWLNKSRQIGASYGFSCEGLAKTHLLDYFTSIFVSYNQEEANEKINYARAMYESVPLRFQRKMVVDRVTALEFEKRTGQRRAITRLISHPQRAVRGKGGNVDVLLDEFAHFTWDTKIYVAAVPVITRGFGQITIASSPLGRTGLHWQIGEDKKRYPAYSRQYVYWYECLPAGTPVYVKGGIKNIEDIDVGDLVLTHKGRHSEVSVVKRQKNRYRKLVSIRCWYNSESLRCTPDHKILVADVGDCRLGGAYKRCRPSCKRSCSVKKQHPMFSNGLQSTLAWKMAGELNGTEYLVFPKSKAREVALDKIDILKSLTINYTLKSQDRYVCAGSGKGTGKRIRRFVKVDSNLMKVIGYFLAEGSVRAFGGKGHSKNGGGVGFSFGPVDNINEAYYVKDLKRAFKSVFGQNLKDSNCVTKKGIECFGLGLCSGVLNNFFGENFGYHHNTKRLPEWVLRLPVNLLEDLVQTYINGDGTTNIIENVTNVGSTSRQLIYQLKEVLSRLGIISSLGKLPASRNNSKWNNMDLWGLHWWSELSKRVEEDDDYEYYPIKNIIEEGHEGYVYDITVPRDNSFVARGFVVHNCIDFLNPKGKTIFEEVQKKAPLMSTEERVITYGNESIVQAYYSSHIEDFMQEYELRPFDERESYYPITLINSCTFEALSGELNIDGDDIYGENPITVEPVYPGLTYKHYDSIEELAYAIDKGQVGKLLYAGYDVGRYENASELIVIEEIKKYNDFHMVRLGIGARNLPFEDQQNLLEKAFRYLPIRKMAIDVTGIGKQLGEYMKKRYRSRIEEVDFGTINKQEMAVNIKIRMEDQIIGYPTDRDLIKQIHSIKREISTANQVRFIAEEDRTHHGDKFWALALATSCGTPAQQLRFMSRPKIETVDKSANVINLDSKRQFPKNKDEFVLPSGVETPPLHVNSLGATLLNFER